MAVVHSYVRFSSYGQLENDSLPRQTGSAEDFCQRHKHQLSNLVFHDLAKSAYRKNKQAALNRFLKAIKDGDVRPGEIFLCEAVDRLSRKGIRHTQDLVNEILNAGIDIAILKPIEKVYRAKDTNDIGGAIELAAFAYQASVYSELLSGRIKSVWGQARKDAINGRPVSGKAPYWLTPIYEYDTKGKPHRSGWKTNPLGVAAIQYLFQRTIDGIGNEKLCGELNDKFPHKKGNWNKTYVRNLIRDRSVRGEYQPHALDEHGKRQPIGEVIKDYYPEIIDEKTWLAANRAMSNRFIERGPSANFINLFTGVVWYVPDDCPAHIYSSPRRQSDGKKTVTRRLKSYKAKEKVKGASTATVDLVSFEKAILKYLVEVDPKTLKARGSNTIEIAALQEEISRKEKWIAELEAALTDGGESVKSLLQSLNTNRQTVKELKTSIQKLTASKGGNIHQDLESIRAVAADPANRQELRELIKRVVKQIRIWPTKMGKQRKSHVACMVEIVFHAGHRRFISMLNGKSAAIQFPTDKEEDELLGPFLYRVWKQYLRKGIKGVTKTGYDDEDTVLFTTTATAEFQTEKKPRKPRKARSPG